MDFVEVRVTRVPRGWRSSASGLGLPKGVMEMFGEAHYQMAYQRGLAWADEVFHGFIRSGQPIPRELPLSKHDAATVLESSLADLERHTRAASVLYATARVRWRRLVSRELNRRIGS